jgi:outer membrane protein
MRLSIALGPVAACCALFAFSHTAAAQSKVAVVNLQKAIFETAEIKKADAEMQATFKPKQDEMEQLNKEIQGIAQKLQGGKLTPPEEADLTAQGQRKQRQLQRLQDDVNEQAQAYRNDILSKSQQKMTDVVKKLAEEKGVDVIVDTSTTLYFKPALDLTADVTAAYDKAHPATKSASAAPSK